MKRLRNDRYDVSITTTRDNAKLPNWATVMSESAEVTDALLTPELVKAIGEAGELLGSSFGWWESAQKSFAAPLGEITREATESSLLSTNTAVQGGSSLQRAITCLLQDFHSSVALHKNSKRGRAILRALENLVDSDLESNEKDTEASSSRKANFHYVS